ncbi:hypothetical protein AA3266_2749 [Gluconobacter kondonii NBRC 3266]|nr:hypothetical protein AA3266_2749 [Gluconobacter kondonii NBRC 3266]
MIHLRRRDIYSLLKKKPVLFGTMMSSTGLIPGPSSRKQWKTQCRKILPKKIAQFIVTIRVWPTGRKEKSLRQP